MNQDNDLMKQITDMLYKDVVQKLEPPLPSPPIKEETNVVEPAQLASQNNQDEIAMPPPPPIEEREEEEMNKSRAIEDEEEGMDTSRAIEDEEEGMDTSRAIKSEDEEDMDKSRDVEGEDIEVQETKQPVITAKSFNFDDIVDDNDLYITENVRKEQQQIINAALAALLASNQPPNDKQTLDSNAGQQQIINAALAALLASKQSPNDKQTLDSNDDQQQIINAALAALLVSKQAPDDNEIVSGDKQRLSQMLEALERTKQSGLTSISTIKDSMKDMYQNIPTIEMPKFMSNVFEGLLEPDLEYYNVPNIITDKLRNMYDDYKVVAIKCNSWDNNNYCNEAGGKYYLYSSKDDKPKIIVLDAKGDEIK